MSWGKVIESDDHSCPKTKAVIDEYDFIYPDVLQRISFTKGNMLIETRFKEENSIKLKIETPDIHDYYNIVFRMMHELWKAYPRAVLILDETPLGEAAEDTGWKHYKESIRKCVSYKLTPIFDWDTRSMFIVPAGLGFMEKMEFIIAAYNKDRSRIIKEMHEKT